MPVPAAELADLVLVPASLEDGDLGVFLVEPGAAGVSLVPLVTTTGQPASLMQLDGVRVGGDAILGGVAAGRGILEWMLLRATAAQCAQGLGVCEAALEQTADYIKERKQFGQPLAMFQAVGHRAADAFIDIQGVRLTAQQACWRLAAGLPAEREVALAKYWLADAGARIVAAAQHLHGGIGVDRDYPVHRFYLWAKQLELDLGGSTAQLRRIGRILAEMPLEQGSGLG
jgi:acyl-CoA dehydrogenase